MVHWKLIDNYTIEGSVLTVGSYYKHDYETCQLLALQGSFTRDSVNITKLFDQQLKEENQLEQCMSVCDGVNSYLRLCVASIP